MRVTISLRVVGDVFGKYRVLGPLGKGGMAAVYLGEHVDSRLQVAIKVLRPEHRTRRVAVERFMNEARAISRLDHPGIVRLFDVGRRGTAAYFVMELLRGEALSRRLAKIGPVPERVAATFGSQIAAALAHAHASGIVHRDLKPGNVFLVPHAGGERAVVLDFGIAKELFRDAAQGGELTGVGMMVGTPAYMSPEQCKDGRSVDHRSDIYSLGVLLYRMVTGVLPFDDPDTAVLFERHMHHAPAPPSRHDATLSAALDRVILRCLEKEPGDRWQSMEAVVAALAPLFQGEPRRMRTRTLLPLPPPDKTPTPQRLRADTATGEITQADEVPDTAAQIELLVGSDGVALPTPAAKRARRRPTWLAAAAAAAVGAVVVIVVAGGGGDPPPPAALEGAPAVETGAPERSAAAPEPEARAQPEIEPAALELEPAELEITEPDEVEIGAAGETAPALAEEPARRRGGDADRERVATSGDDAEERRDERRRSRSGQRERDREGAEASGRRRERNQTRARRDEERARQRTSAQPPEERAERRREKSFDQVETPALF